MTRVVETRTGTRESIKRSNLSKILTPPPDWDWIEFIDKLGPRKSIKTIGGIDPDRNPGFWKKIELELSLYILVWQSCTLNILSEQIWTPWVLSDRIGSVFPVRIEKTRSCDLAQFRNRPNLIEILIFFDWKVSKFRLEFNRFWSTFRLVPNPNLSIPSNFFKFIDSEQIFNFFEIIDRFGSNFQSILDQLFFKFRSKFRYPQSNIRYFNNLSNLCNWKSKYSINLIYSNRNFSTFNQIYVNFFIPTSNFQLFQ
jgi:hypothetical protein